LRQEFLLSFCGSKEVEWWSELQVYGARREPACQKNMCLVLPAVVDSNKQARPPARPVSYWFDSNERQAGFVVRVRVKVLTQNRLSWSFVGPTCTTLTLCRTYLLADDLLLEKLRTTCKDATTGITITPIKATFSFIILLAYR
jgi:hypothetical protein